MKKLTPVLMVEDVNATIEFYKNILGFSCPLTVPETEPFIFAILQSGNVQIMIQQKESLLKEFPYLDKYKTLGGSFTLYIEVDDAFQFYNHIKDKITVIRAIKEYKRTKKPNQGEAHRVSYATQEFSVVDCNSYVLTFASPIS